jgi:hypothetical protein
MNLDQNEVERLAKEELERESFRQAVETQKLKLKQKRSLLDRLLPWTITVRRKQ